MTKSLGVKKAITPYIVIVIVSTGLFMVGFKIDENQTSNSFNQDYLKVQNATRLTDQTRDGFIDRIELEVQTGSKGVILKDVILYAEGQENQWTFEKPYSLPSRELSKIVILSQNETNQIDSLVETEIFVIYSLLGQDRPLVTNFAFITPYVEPGTSYVFGIFFEPGKSTGLVGPNQSLVLQATLAKRIVELDDNFGVRIIKSQDVLRAFIEQVTTSARERYLIFVQDKIPKFLLSQSETPRTKLGEYFDGGGHLLFVGGRPLFETYSSEGDVSYADAVERVFDLPRIIGSTLISARSAFIHTFENSTNVVQSYYHQASNPVIKSYLELQNISYRAYGASKNFEFLEPVILFFPSAMATFAYSGIITPDQIQMVIENSLGLLRVMVFEWSQKGGV
ncbi:MAG: hypothetical protein D6732_12235 [Methanobacteriota archaeon]|nr:MAG: hypothetical protein D6732_12235 [Euryarchaeota archaeon]